MEKPKRSRCANWDLEEKLLLKECIKENLKIIESKSCDTNTNKKKQEAWMQVLRRFNELNNKERAVAEIKQQWRCAKLEAKKCASIYKKSLRQTGGGPKPPSPPPVVQDIINMIPHEFEEDHNKYDSDNVPFLVEQEKPNLDNISFNDTANKYNIDNQISLEAGSSRQTGHDSRDNIIWLDQTNNNCIDNNQISSEAGSSRQTGHNSRDNIIWPDETNNITLERQPDRTGVSKTKCPDSMRNFGKNNVECSKRRDMVLIECVREEHKLKIKQMTEAQQWAKEEHDLKIKHLQLQIRILENELKDINPIV